MKIAHNAILQEKNISFSLIYVLILNLADNVRFFISSFSFLSYTKNSMKKKVTKVRLHKALQPSFIKRMYYMRFLGNLQKLRKRRVENFFVQCLSPIPFTLQEQFANEPYVFEGVCSNKRMKKSFRN